MNRCETCGHWQGIKPVYTITPIYGDCPELLGDGADGQVAITIYAPEPEGLGVRTHKNFSCSLWEQRDER